MITEFEKMVSINEYEARMNREIQGLVERKRLSGENIEKAKARVKNISEWLETLPLDAFPDLLMVDNQVFDDWMFKDVAIKAKAAGIQ